MKNKKNEKEVLKWLCKVIVALLLVTSIICLFNHLKKGDVEQTELDNKIISSEVKEEKNNKEENEEVVEEQVEIKNEEQQVLENDLETMYESEKIYYVSANSINVRSGASKSTEVIDGLSLNNEVTVIGESGDWYIVNINDTKGYIAKTLLSTTKKEVVKKEVTSRSSSSIREQSATNNTEYSQSETDDIDSSQGEWETFNVSFYCPCSKCCDGYANGITASGVYAQAGITIAAPSKYAFGTQIYLEGMGTYTVQDRGGAIKGNKIDVYVNSHEEALRLGRKQVRGYVVNK